MELIDTHCHLTLDELADDIEAAIARSREAGVTSWITVGTNLQESRKAVELACKYENMYASVGAHPRDRKVLADDDIPEFIGLAMNKKVVAIGETGLDLHYNFSPPVNARSLFRGHLQLAADLNLPVIIHSREAFEETMEVLESYIGLRGRPTKVVFHNFCGSAEQAKMVLDKGHYISFSGVVTSKNAEGIRAAAKIVPVDKLMLETECPYGALESMGKQEPNEPAGLVNTAKCLAELKGMDLSDFAKGVTATSKYFFSLPDT